MLAIINIFLAVPTSLTQSKIQIELNKTSWFVIVAFVALLLLNVFVYGTC